jgi:predicted amidohydrolase YtcJ
VSSLVIRTEVDGQVVDVRLDDGQIVALAPKLEPQSGDEVLDAGGGALLPGLHDHHIHLMAFAAARRSIPLGPPDVIDATGFDAALRAAVASGGEMAEGWLRGTGYHESVAGDLNRHRLDAVVPHRPVRIQHRSGALWVLNSAAIELVRLNAGTPSGVERDASGVPTGRIYGLDEWLRERLPPDPPDLAGAAEELLAYGVTGLTDATPTEDPDHVALLADAVGDGRVPQRLVITGGLRLPPHAGGTLERGPVKLVVADYDLPALDDLTASIEAAHDQGRPVAIHCVTRAALLLALAAWDDAGPRAGDRVEHAAVAGPAEADRLAASGITVVTQPGFVAERGDAYLADVDPEDQPDLWPCASLLEAGVAVGGSTDAPFGHADPWRAIAAATTRRTRSGRLLGAEERLDAGWALKLFLTSPDDPGGLPRRVSVGEPADLCLLFLPLNAALEEPSSAHVAATFLSGLRVGHARRRAPADDAGH